MWYFIPSGIGCVCVSPPSSFQIVVMLLQKTFWRYIDVPETEVWSGGEQGMMVILLALVFFRTGSHAPAACHVSDFLK